MGEPMTDEQAESLGRRWLAAGGGWMPGMLARLSLGRVWFRVGRSGGGNLLGWNSTGSTIWSDDGCWPDLRDPATRGAALQVVRDVSRCESLHLTPTVYDDTGEFLGWEWDWVDTWPYDPPTVRDMVTHATEDEAIVAAMEALSLDMSPSQATADEALTLEQVNDALNAIRAASGRDHD